MGANAGPDIVSDGLVLALDAADNNSFRGEPTVNYIPDTFSYGLYAYASGPVDTTVLNENNKSITAKRYTITNAINTARAAIRPTTTTGVAYTFSFKWKYNGTTTTSPAIAVSAAKGNPEGGANNNGLTSQTSSTVSVGNGWYLTTYTFVFSSNPTSGCILTFGINTGSNSSYVGETFDIYEAQFEIKSSKTRFVNGTRGTTVATGGGWADISGNDNHGEILNGTTTSNDGSVLGALDFDGTNDYIEIPYNSSLAPSTAITMEALCYVLNNGGNWISVMQYPYSSASHTSPYFEWGMYLNMNDRKMHTRIDGETADSSTLVWNFNEWTHFVITFEAQTVKFYVNGQNVGNDTVTKNSITYNTNNNILISGNASTTELHEGKIAYCRLYNRALSASEVLQNYNATKTRFGL